jgi:hypothetical protein
MGCSRSFIYELNEDRSEYQITAAGEYLEQARLYRMLGDHFEGGKEFTVNPEHCAHCKNYYDYYLDIKKEFI